MTLLNLNSISKNFKQGKEFLTILSDVSLSLSSGQIISIVGASGSGKSTLLMIIGLLESPDSGSILFDGVDCTTLDDQGQTKMRREAIGFVYQYHHLLPEFSALENVMLPRMLISSNARSIRKEAMQLLDQLGLSQRWNHIPSELSGGEQQRVAIARSLINKPKIILADEPTGNLDQDQAVNTLNLLIQEVKSRGVGAIIVTHNLEFARKTDKILTLSHGRLQEYK
ncbi:ABC transporter ATP-binding protein [Rickettsiales endosymbiont of Peranema trichophorum]|uniref:ABC transporter ATP-binding protein n=1 Tax=Rickettsiales endosymbiont of Peranema trichophorum TaxID=2486577 RepID=UPI0010231DEF|nr:ABC transporter ATP-binding protein [Rickettsiales endosymbiont of Peranema trichophorum]RZI47804.1 ABC transporter ATP-binding protein [Rickettsiales endosymbiont of Peranema trichophorum]